MQGTEVNPTNESDVNVIEMEEEQGQTWVKNINRWILLYLPQNYDNAFIPWYVYMHNYASKNVSFFNNFNCSIYRQWAFVSLYFDYICLIPCSCPNYIIEMLYKVTACSFTVLFIHICNIVAVLCQWLSNFAIVSNIKFWLLSTFYCIIDKGAESNPNINSLSPQYNWFFL